MSPLNFRRQPFPLLSELAQSFGIAEALGSTQEQPRGYACIQAAGSDTASFLQGQMTADIASLETGRCRTSALCNPKGRVIAQIEVARINDDSYALIMAHPQVATVTATLSRYIMRSKVTLGTWPGQPLIVLRRTDSAPETGACRLDGNGVLSCRPNWLPDNEPSWELSNAGFDEITRSDPPSQDSTWAHAHVLLGIAPPVTATQLEHIPQMLNLDALDAISMTKGCYTGQEIIARVHHRGAVKRRLRRFVADASDGISTGDSVKNAAGANAGLVVEVAHDAHQHLGVLAVVKESDFTPEATLSCQGLPLDHWPLPYSV